MFQSTLNIIKFIQNIQAILKVFLFIDMMPLAIKIEIANKHKLF